MSLLAALRDRWRRWPRPDDVAAVRAMTATQWRGIAQRTPTYLAGYIDRPGSDDRAQRRAEWLAAQPIWGDIGDMLELGCACGRNLAALHRRHPHMVLRGMDISAEAIAEARRVVPSSFLHVEDLYDAHALWAFLLPAAVLTVGVLGHLEPDFVRARLLPTLLGMARTVVLVEEPGQGEVAKGPRAWNPERDAQNYVLWRHPLPRWLAGAGALQVEVALLPEDLRAPGATAMLVARR